MKKLLLATVAAGSLALASAPAHADVELEIGGYFKGYGTFVDGETDDAFDIIRDTELHIGGETTLDNGLTIGAHFEFDADGGDNFAVDESYAYFSGNWGRVNVGREDGAAYLLQVAAPSADSNIDGIRQYVSPFTNNIDYAHDQYKTADKFTYLSPIVNGFQAGASYASSDNVASSTGADVTTDSAYEIALRYEGQFDNVGVIAGAGWSAAEDEEQAYNVGLDLDVSAFGLGVVYGNEEVDASTESEVLVIGADYTTGPFKLGASYLNNETDTSTPATDEELDRYTAGVVYQYGPGMSFRGSVSYQDETLGTTDSDSTAVTIGTQINF